MGSDLFFENKKYISAKDAAKLTGYSKDYVGQLCRGNKIEAKRIGHTWYVSEDSILKYKTTPTTFDFAQNLKPKVEPIIISEPMEVTSDVHIVSEPHLELSQEAKDLNNGVSSPELVQVVIPSLPQHSKHSILSNQEAHLTFPEINKILLVKKSGLSPQPVLSSFGLTKALSTVLVLMIFVVGLSSVNSKVGSFVSKFSDLNLRELTASVVDATNTETANAVDHAGLVVYNSVNSWFDQNVFSPIAGLFKKNVVPGNTYVVNNIATTTKSTVTPTPTLKSSTPNNQVAVSTTKVINNTNVIERTVERVITQPSDITASYLELKLQELNNSILAKLYSLSTGTGGNVTNIYQQIANSQRIDQLTNTVINTPTINGGTINNATINGTIGAGTTTVSNLIVTNTSTSTYNGGIAVVGGCVSVNGTCLGTGSGGGSAGGTFSTTTSTVSGQLVNYSNNNSDILVIGSNSTTTGEFWYDPNSLVGFFSGNVGIGTTSPYTSLGVAGTIVANNINATSTTATSTFSGGVSVRNLVVTGLSSSTFSNGINLTSGCFAVNGSCITGSGTGASTTLLSDGNFWSGLQTFVYSSSTGYSSFNNASTTNLYAGFINLSTSTAGTLKTTSTGLVYVDTSSGTAASSTLLSDTNFFSGVNRFNFSSTTYGSFTTASTTNFILNGSTFTSLL
ncbi:MAG: helix-turn-helix domain-containing protein, partial [Minisyncoccia bacterium]